MTPETTDPNRIVSAVHRQEHIVVWSGAGVVLTAMPLLAELPDQTPLVVLQVSARIAPPPPPPEAMKARLVEAYPDPGWTMFKGDRIGLVRMMGLWGAGREDFLADLCAAFLSGFVHPEKGGGGGAIPEDKLMAFLKEDIAMLGEDRG